jgi:hypothetical protein
LILLHYIIFYLILLQERFKNKQARLPTLKDALRRAQKDYDRNPDDANIKYMVFILRFLKITFNKFLLFIIFYYLMLELFILLLLLFYYLYACAAE